MTCMESKNLIGFKNKSIIASEMTSKKTKFIVVESYFDQFGVLESKLRVYLGDDLKLETISLSLAISKYNKL